MQSRINELKKLGIPTEFHAYGGVERGVGLGTGTAAYGWLNRAVAFWEKNVTIHGCSKYHAKNLPAKLSVAAKPAAFVFLMMFRTACTLISENTHSLTCRHEESEYFLKSAVNSN